MLDERGLHDFIVPLLRNVNPYFGLTLRFANKFTRLLLRKLRLLQIPALPPEMQKPHI